MWKIFHLLFGWDYIQWRNFADQGIARVHRNNGGGAYYWRYKSTRLADRIEKQDQVIWLTCDPSKYI